MLKSLTHMLLESQMERKEWDRSNTIPSDTNRIFKTSDRHQVTYSIILINSNHNKYQKQTNKNFKIKKHTHVATSESNCRKPVTGVGFTWKSFYPQRSNRKTATVFSKETES